MLLRLPLEPFFAYEVMSTIKKIKSFSFIFNNKWTTNHTIKSFTASKQVLCALNREKITLFVEPHQLEDQVIHLFVIHKLQCF